MAYNNTVYRLFQEMLDGYKNNSDGWIEHGARCLMEMNPENPFEEGSQQNELFYQVYVTYARWKNGSVDAKINMRRMLAYAKELCAIVEANPYTFDEEEDKRDKEEQKRKEEEEYQKELERQEEIKRLEELKKQEEQKRLEEEKLKADEGTKVFVKEEPEHILGVIPEEKEKEEKKSWFRFLHPWKQ